MVSTESAPFTSTDLRREISVFLRAADDPDSLTFKQVRLAVEESLALPKGSLSNAGFKSKIKATVLSVMAEIDGEAGNENAEDDREDEEDFEDNSPDSDQDDDDADDKTNKNHNNNKKGNRNNNKRGRDRAESSPDSHRKSAGRKRRESGPDSESADSESGDDDANGKVAGKGRGQKAATASGVTKKGKVKGAGKADPGKPKGRGHELGGGAEDEDATLVCVLSQTKLNRRQVNVRDWKGNIQVDIREHYQRKGTEDFAPSRKGISLNPTQWKALKKATRHVDEMLRQMA